MKHEIFIVALAAGLLAGCATHDYAVAELSDLPFEVQRTVLEQAPNGDIAKVERKTEMNQIVYDVSFHNPAVYPELHIASDGTLLEHGRPVIMHERAGAAHVVVPSVVVPTVVETPSRLKTDDLPLAVVNAIRSHAPNSRIAGIHKNVRNQEVYEIQFAEPGSNPTLHITEDGTVIQGD